MSDSDNDVATTAAALKRARVDEQLQQQPWIEKYRPSRLAEVEGQEEAVSALRRIVGLDGAGGARNFAAANSMPHLLFHGPAGTGKSSAVLAAMRELFQPAHPETASAATSDALFRQRVRELNASDERGIQVIREKVKQFAQGAVMMSSAGLAGGGSNEQVTFKVIILDEADALQGDAQAALRRMMEDYSAVTRFCILCNYVSRIIDPITSRCAKFRFKPLRDAVMFQRIRHIAGKEGIQLSDASLARLDAAAGGDMRLAIMHLQSAARAYGNDLRNQDFVSVAGLVPAEHLGRYIAQLSGPTTSFDEMYAATHQIVRMGFSAQAVLAQIHNALTGQQQNGTAAVEMSDLRRALLLLHIARVEKRLLDGGDDFLGLASLAAKFTETRGK